MFDKLRGLFGGKNKSNSDAHASSQPQVEIGIRDGFSPQLQAILERSSARSLEEGKAVEMALRSRFGDGYRLGIDVHKSVVAVAKAGGTTPELELPCFITGTELGGTTDEFQFVWPWANQMLGLPPFPVWTEFANEVQQIGGGADGVEEFYTPMLRYRTEQDLNTFYMGIQGWSKLPAFYRLAMGPSKLVVFLETSCMAQLGLK